MAGGLPRRVVCFVFFSSSSSLLVLLFFVFGCRPPDAFQLSPPLHRLSAVALITFFFGFPLSSRYDCFERFLVGLAVSFGDATGAFSMIVRFDAKRKSRPFFLLGGPFMASPRRSMAIIFHYLFTIIGRRIIVGLLWCHQLQMGLT